jgi:hypothetical protein
MHNEMRIDHGSDACLILDYDPLLQNLDYSFNKVHRSPYRCHLLMLINQILAKKLVGTAVKDGATVKLSVATRTTYWTRPDIAVDKVGIALSKSLPSWKEPLPNDTKEICSR